MSVVVSDTSPLRTLNHLGLMGILGQLFDRVFVPPAVLQELTQPRPRFEPVDVSSHESIEIRAPQDASRVKRFLQLLDAGESEALALALEVSAEALLIDETNGRSVAVGQGMSVIGTLSILSRAKTRGQIVRIEPLLDRLIGNLDFYVSAELRREFLSGVGE